MSVPTAVVPTAQQQAVRQLTVLYDAECPLCRWVRDWLELSSQQVPLQWVACGSPQARARFGWLDQQSAREEVTVVSDTGAVWRGGDAWIACLWATSAHRGLANRLAQPRWRPHARAMALQVARRMQRTSQPASCRITQPAGG
jgi:predicted DCC family thiol-disulfide oxidoreductase YuxK